MGKTTVDLTEIAQSIKKGLMPIFGLKNVLSAGLLLFSKLSAEQQKHAIAEANGLQVESEPTEKKTLQGALDMIKEMVEVEKQQPGTIFRVLTTEEQSVINEFRKLIEPKLKPKKKLKRG